MGDDAVYGTEEDASYGTLSVSGGSGSLTIEGSTSAKTEVEIAGNFVIEAASVTIGNSGSVSVQGSASGNSVVKFTATTLTAAATTGTSTISVKGTVGEDGDVSATTTLDLTAVTNFSHDTNSGGLVSLIAEEGGVIEVTGTSNAEGTDLSDVLSATVGTSGFAFVLSGGSSESSLDDGKLFVEGDLTASVASLLSVTGKCFHPAHIFYPSI